MRTEQLNTLTEQLFPYYLGAEKRNVDGKRLAFIKGYNYDKSECNKSPLTITHNDVCEIASTIYGGNIIFVVTKIIMHVGGELNTFCLMGVADKILWLSISVNGDFELTSGDQYNDSVTIGLDSRSVLDGYRKLKQLGYDIK